MIGASLCFGSSASIAENTILYKYNKIMIEPQKKTWKKGDCEKLDTGEERVKHNASFYKT